MVRPVLALERLLFLEREGQVGYRHGPEGAELERMDYLEFIARVTSPIPDKGQVMVRYYGLYPNAEFFRHLGLTFAAEKPPPVGGGRFQGIRVLGPVSFLDEFRRPELLLLEKGRRHGRDSVEI